MNQKIYYHFLSSNFAMQDLEYKRIKVSRLDSLNDPFELIPFKRYPRETRILYDKVFRRINRKWGLLCFTESWEEQLLWSHYADGHKGIALGFEILKDELIKVGYSTDEKRKIIELSGDPIVDEENFLKLASIKYRLWAYEKEYRILVRLDDCVFNDSHYFLTFGSRLRLREIVLGCKFDHITNMERLCILANRLDAKIIPTRQGWQDYKIHISGYHTNKYEEEAKTLGFYNTQISKN